MSSGGTAFRPDSTHPVGTAASHSIVAFRTDYGAGFQNSWTTRKGAATSTRFQPPRASPCRCIKSGGCGIFIFGVALTPCCRRRRRHSCCRRCACANCGRRGRIALQIWAANRLKCICICSLHIYCTGNITQATHTKSSLQLSSRSENAASKICRH